MKNENLVPKVRFKGFSDPWEQRKLGDISKITAGGDIDKDKLSTRGRYPVIANALTNNGVVGYYDSYKVKGPAVTVTGRGDVGHAKTRIESFTPIVRLLVVSAPNFDINFLENAINNIRIFNESTGVPQLTAPQLGSYEFEYPCSSEQVCIGNVLHKIDNLIAANEDKLEQLKTLKKLMMQKIFSQEWRFKGFTDPWEQRKLKNISLEIGTGKSRFIKFNKSEKYMYKILGSTSIIGYTNHFDYEGDFILTARVGANAGTIYRESGKVKISDNTVFIKASQINFLYYVLTNYNLKRLSFGTGQPLIKSSELNKLKLEVPTNELEQQELGVIFFTIDTLIAANEDKLNQLKELKKYLMQNMFV